MDKEELDDLAHGNLFLGFRVNRKDYVTFPSSLRKLDDLIDFIDLTTKAMDQTEFKEKFQRIHWFYEEDYWKLSEEDQKFFDLLFLYKSAFNRHDMVESYFKKESLESYRAEYYELIGFNSRPHKNKFFTIEYVDSSEDDEEDLGPTFTIEDGELKLLESDPIEEFNKTEKYQDRSEESPEAKFIEVDGKLKLAHFNFVEELKHIDDIQGVWFNVDENKIEIQEIPGEELKENYFSWKK